MEVKITLENFDEEVLNSDIPVIVDFYADWCGPCKMLAPAIEALEGEIPEAKFCKVNVDNDPDIARLFKVQSIPFIALVKNNTFLDFSVGLVPKDKLSALIRENL